MVRGSSLMGRIFTIMLAMNASEICGRLLKNSGQHLPQTDYYPYKVATGSDLQPAVNYYSVRLTP